MKLQKLLAELSALLSVLFLLSCDNKNTVSYGELTEELYANMPNVSVTEDNLEEFIGEFKKAVYYDVDKPDGKQKSFVVDTTVASIYGDGRVVVNMKMKSSSSKTDISIGSFIGNSRTENYFDYSTDGKLFVGGTVNQSVDIQIYMYDVISFNTLSMICKLNGTYTFMGSFAGSVVVNNFGITTNINNEIIGKGGEVIIKSGDSEVKLSAERYWKLMYGLDTPVMLP